MKATQLIGIALGLLLATPAVAHHSVSVYYLRDKQLVIEGVVTEYEFVNPHIRVYLEVAGTNGAAEQWTAEGAAAIVLRRRGLTEASIKPGDRIRVLGNPSRDGSNLIHWITLTLPDGSELYGEAVDFGAADRRRGQQAE